MGSDRRNQRPQRLWVPPRRAYPEALTPTPTPSKHRLSSGGAATNSNSNSNSLSLVVLLLSLRSLYSLLPFLQSSPPSFSLFPFSFLVSLLSFLLTLSLSLLLRHRPSPTLTLQIQPSHFRLLLPRSALLALLFLLRFQALRYCGTAALILSEFSGTIAFQFLLSTSHLPKASLSLFLALPLLLLSASWDRLDCFPFSSANLPKFILPPASCVRIGPLLLPFLSGFLASYDRRLIGSRQLRQLGHNRIQLVSLFLTSLLLFFPAALNLWFFEGAAAGVSVANLGWPLANTVVFGVLLNELFTAADGDDKDLEKQFLLTFAFTLGLELLYHPEDLSLLGLFICGLLFWIPVRLLTRVYSSYVELGMESPDSLYTLVMKPIRHILSERKSRKIALFLIINTLYMFVEFVAGFMSNSLGLISDACHMLFDCAALAIGLYASYIARLPANAQYNYGRGRFEVLSGYANAVFLVLVGALIVLESFERILDPQEVSTNSLLVVSIGGLLVNLIGLVFFHEEHHHAHGGGHGSCSHSHSHSHSSPTEHDHSANCHDHKHDHEGDHSTDTAKCHDHLNSHHTHEHGHGHANEHHDHSHDTDKYHPHSKSDAPGSISFGSSTGLRTHSFKSHDDGISHSHGGDCSAGAHLSTSKDHSSCQVSCSKQKEVLNQHAHEHSQKHVTNNHHHIDHNMEGIFLHVLADTLGSVGVVISTLLIKFKGWLIADPACSIFISVLIVSSVIPLLRNSAETLLQRIPRSHERDLKQALNDVMNIKGVCGIQNLHVWSLTNTDVVGTLHLHVSTETDRFYMKKAVSDIFKNAGVKDLTLQVECVQK